MKKQKLPLLFLALPGIILIFFFGYLPLFGLVIAFKNVDYSKGIWASDWVGLKNFEFFFKSNDALRVTRNTLVMNALFIVFTLIVSVSVAIMLYYVGRRMLRVTQVLPFWGSCIFQFSVGKPDEFLVRFHDVIEAAFVMTGQGIGQHARSDLFHIKTCHYT